MSSDSQNEQISELILQQKSACSRYIMIQPTLCRLSNCWDEEKMAATVRALQTDVHQSGIASVQDAKEQKMVAHTLEQCL